MRGRTDDDTRDKVHGARHVPCVGKFRVENDFERRDTRPDSILTSLAHGSRPTGPVTAESAASWMGGRAREDGRVPQQTLRRTFGILSHTQRPTCCRDLPEFGPMRSAGLSTPLHAPIGLLDCSPEALLKRVALT